MTDSVLLNWMLAFIVGAPMFYVAWRILRLMDRD